MGKATKERQREKQRTQEGRKGWKMKGRKDTYTYKIIFFLLHSFVICFGFSLFVWALVCFFFYLFGGVGSSLPHCSSLQSHSFRIFNFSPK